MAKTYFHFSGVSLGVGSVILRGNYGRILAGYPAVIPPAAYWKLTVEKIFESVRQSAFPNAPSRLNSSFMFQTEQEARANRHSFNGNMVVLYQVELTDPNGAQHLGDMNLATQSFVLNAPNAASNAQAYWSGVAGGVMEMLADSDMRIVKTIS